MRTNCRLETAGFVLRAYFFFGKGLQMSRAEYFFVSLIQAHPQKDQPSIHIPNDPSATTFRKLN